MWALDLTQALPIDPLVFGAVLPHIIGILEQVLLRESDGVHTLRQGKGTSKYIPR